jgi:hypothetical protein
MSKGKRHNIGNPGRSQIYGDAFERRGVTSTEDYYPTDLLQFPVQRGVSFSRAQDFAQYMVRTYTNPDDCVLDICCSNGPTGLACKAEKRRFIGLDLSPQHFALAAQRQ